MTDTERKSFTSRKLDLMNAINADTRLKMSERVLAHELLYYSSDTGEIFPSQELLANTLGLKPRAIKYGIANLVRHGWLTVDRPHRSKSNRYTFDDSNISFFVSRRQRVRDDLATVRGRKLPLPNLGEGQNGALPEVQNGAPQRGTELPPNTFNEPPKVITFNPGQDKKGTDLGIGQCEQDEEGLAPRSTQTASKQALPAPAQGYVDPSAILDRIAAAGGRR